MEMETYKGYKELVNQKQGLYNEKRQAPALDSQTSDFIVLGFVS